VLVDPESSGILLRNPAFYMGLSALCFLFVKRKCGVTGDVHDGKESKLWNSLIRSTKCNAVKTVRCLQIGVRASHPH
jgi:hypothetical protein